MIAFHALEFLKFHHVYLRGPVEVREHRSIRVVQHEQIGERDREVEPQEFSDITGLQIKQAGKVFRPKIRKVTVKKQEVYSFIK